MTQFITLHRVIRSAGEMSTTAYSFNVASIDLFYDFNVVIGGSAYPVMETSAEIWQKIEKSS